MGTPSARAEPTTFSLLAQLQARFDEECACRLTLKALLDDGTVVANHYRPGLHLWIDRALPSKREYEQRSFKEIW